MVSIESDEDGPMVVHIDIVELHVLFEETVEVELLVGHIDEDLESVVHLENCLRDYEEGLHMHTKSFASTHFDHKIMVLIIDW